MTDTIDIPDEFYKKLEDTLRVYHSGNPYPLKTGVSEQIFQIALVRADIEHEWFWNDKGSGTDFHNVNGKYALSAKSTTLSGKNTVRFNISGPRTTSHSTLEEKIDHIAEHHEEVSHLVFARRTDRGVEYDEKKNKGEGYIDYRILLIPGDHKALDPTNKNWVEDENKWKAEIGSEDTPPNLTINKSMSDQFWANSLDYEGFKEFEEKRIRVPHKECVEEFDDYDIYNLVRVL